jgi:hypothetical protein
MQMYCSSVSKETYKVWKDTTYVNAAIAIQVAKMDCEIVHIGDSIGLRANRAVHDSHWLVERWEFRALLVCVAEHIDVSTRPMDNEDVAETVTVPVAEVD